MSEDRLVHLIANVAAQLNGCVTTNNRGDLTPFEARLTHDRAVDMLNRVVDVFLQERGEYDVRSSSPDRAARAMRLLRAERATGLPDEEDIDEAIRQRNRSIHEAHPVESTREAAQHAEIQARRMARAIAHGLDLLPAEAGPELEVHPSD